MRGTSAAADEAIAAAVAVPGSIITTTNAAPALVQGLHNTTTSAQLALTNLNAATRSLTDAVGRLTPIATQLPGTLSTVKKTSRQLEKSLKYIGIGLMGLCATGVAAIGFNVLKEAKPSTIQWFVQRRRTFQAISGGLMATIGTIGIVCAAYSGVTTYFKIPPVTPRRKAPSPPPVQPVPE
ncbi:MAG: hypothetical protein HY069_00880 [Chlamydiia bacterium]|nr:hypothetical protein [Chlamydiia bacterium]